MKSLRNFPIVPLSPDETHFEILTPLTIRQADIRLQPEQAGVILVLRGSLHLKCSTEGMAVDTNPAFLFNGSDSWSVAFASKDLLALYIRTNSIFIQKALSKIKYKPGNFGSNERIASIRFPETNETALLLSGVEKLLELCNYTAPAALLDSRLIEIFWFLNTYANRDFARFVHPYFVAERVMFDSLLQKHFKQNISLETWSQLAGCSVSTFKRKFFAAYQCSPKRWIQNLRLNEARSLLEFTDLSVSQIGYDVGFENISHFIQAFRQRFGLTPGMLRDGQSSLGNDRSLSIAS